MGKSRLHIEDPERGYIVTANNKPAGAGFQNHIYEISMNTARADRLEQMIRSYIDSGKKLNKQTMKEMQLDTIDVYCLETVKVMNARYQEDSKKYALFEPFLNFDCNFSVDATTASLYLSFYYHAYRESLPKKLADNYALSMTFGYMQKIYHFIMDAES